MYVTSYEMSQEKNAIICSSSTVGKEWWGWEVLCSRSQYL